MDKELELFDVTIIGGGPVGLFSAFYSGMREMKTKIIEFLPFLGGKVPYFYPDKVIRDIGGIHAVTGDKLTEQLIEQAKTFDPTIIVERQVEGLERLSNGYFILTDNKGNEHYTKTVIIATGFGTLKSVELDLPNAPRYTDSNLHYFIREVEKFRDKRIVISGGGNSAIDWANELEPIAQSVTLLYRKQDFVGHESNITKMKNSSITIQTPYVIDQLKGDEQRISSVTVKHTESGEYQSLKLDDLIVNHGFVIDLGAISAWGMTMKDGTIQVDGNMQTSIPGIFAVGDIANFATKLPLIAGGFNEGPIAINNAKQYIAPNKELEKLFSTNMDTFDK
ncbi:NAD(P)/FAD-dependent oxidoreductase [Virgibacillus necropolis]|uniref:Ferredoxin--NADP reductase n=1 Tax=Virgibacillus necropolis TaxID=163877 RepID=A0A221MFU2_9BACI|nr:NAD(P)/FAD-dependent oxidoreductase [Virgibacillus necropolis]ASN06543.1 thioredoxin reductase [Virgibacillus necropolis]